MPDMNHSEDFLRTESLHQKEVQSCWLFHLGLLFVFVVVFGGCLGWLIVCLFVCLFVLLLLSHWRVPEWVLFWACVRVLIHACVLFCTLCVCPCACACVCARAHVCVSVFPISKGT